ncbi:MAG: YlxR family protein [Ornithinimicrobium sp.]
MTPHTAQRHIPQRTCVGCRGRDVQSQLLRVAGVRSAVQPVNTVLLLPDPARRAGGRGAYVHRDRSCVDQALRRRAFGRAIRMDGTLDADELLRWIEQHRSGTTEA